jgi:hypothetical protein
VAKTSTFLARVQPSRQRWKKVRWPFQIEGESGPDDRPWLKVRVLGQNEAEEAYLATVDHFKGRKPAVSVTDPAFAMRERVEMVFRAYEAADLSEQKLAENVDELAEQPIALIDELHTTWIQFQADVCAVPVTSKDMEALVELLKKNMDAAVLSALPSSWQTALITTLVAQLPPSTLANEHG